MNYVKNLGIAFAYILGIMLVATLLISLLSYVNFMSGKVLSVFKIIVPIAAFFTGGVIFGKNSKQKGWLEGLKLSLVFLVVMILFNYLGLHHHFQIKDFIYYLILIVSGMVGSMFGINHKKIKE